MKRIQNLAKGALALAALVVFALILALLFRMQGEGGAVTQQTTETPTAIPSATPAATLATAPVSQTMVFLADEAEWGVVKRATIDSQANMLSQAVDLFAPPDEVSRMLPSPNGLYVAINTVWGSVRILDVTTGQVILPQVDGQYIMPGRFLNWTPDSRGLLYVSEGGYGFPEGFWLVTVHDKGHIRYEIPEVRVANAFMSAAVSPDGEVIIYSFSRGLGWGSEVWRMNADGSGRTFMFDSPNRNIGGFDWSPDGTRIVYDSLPDSATAFTSARLWVMNADGGNRRQLADNADGGHGYQPYWSPDNRTIAYVTRENPADPKARVEAEAATNNINLADADTGEVWELLPLTSQHNFDPFWSPDGSMLAFVSDRKGTDEIWTINADGSNSQPLTDDGVGKRYPLWLDQAQLVFLSIVTKGR